MKFQCVIFRGLPSTDGIQTPFAEKARAEPAMAAYSTDNFDDDIPFSMTFKKAPLYFLNDIKLYKAEKRCNDKAAGEKSIGA